MQNPCKLFGAIVHDNVSQHATRDQVAARNTHIWESRNASEPFASSRAAAAPTLTSAISVPDAVNPVHVIDQVFTPEQCESVIASAEAVGFKTRGEAGLIPDMYYEQPDFAAGNVSRAPISTARIIFVRDEVLAGYLYSRIRPLLQSLKMGIGCQGKKAQGSDICKCRENGAHCVAAGVNPLLRILKYEPGQVFSVHSDTSYRTTELCGVHGQYRNGLSVVVYLNEQSSESGEAPAGCFTGGSLNFTERGKVTVVKGQKPVITYPRHDPDVSLQPKIGRVVTFDGEEMHESAAIVSGVKYAIQTDVMFRWCPGEQAQAGANTEA
eukprot:TRINITY_DN2105_c1_g1_i1.p1 TRINITY_DN2105_c1_g1~~TRINITY_DN2105_c1_g1_i1.p1  ORF type:complete len:340 (+),score=85.24 TRINITY_DN2105_c1_g1_i1:50-1021(+)